MGKLSSKEKMRHRRKTYVRRRVSGNSERPRLAVHRSLKHIYAQIVDDSCGRTLAAASSVSLKIAGNTVGAAKEVGKVLGEQAKSKGVERVCFDRGGWLYHGRVKALADGVREMGVEF
ncbi:MAG TPA: 50S ribosomal protein L18 [Candidatus Hydrogenedentes bacterium]|nr:50S ribosomal protein L18 [Candidatus Hydrogenedentota bacterium]HPG69461.1 50S ribosomal protein L18 [Candidatus Hydrogenedentota bacterium]